MAAALDPTVVEAARQRWVAGEPATAIAAALGRPLGTLYFWRHRYQWPHRAAVYSRPFHQSSDSTVQLAKVLWDQGVPRPDIANLCDISLSTLGEWRRRYEWPKRAVGRSLLPGWDRAYRQREPGHPAPDVVERRRVLHEYVARMRNRTRSVDLWRCCDRLWDVPNCGECGRRSPRCA